MTMQPLFVLRRLWPIGFAVFLACAFVGLLALVTRPAHATPSERPPPAANATIRYVLGAGGDDSRNCLDRSFPCATIQRAVDVASSGDTIAVAQGEFSILNSKAGLSQIVYVDKPLTLEGGYSAGFFGSPNPLTPSVINPASGGRGFVITGTVAVTLRGFSVKRSHGAAAELNGNGGGLLVGGGATVRLDQMTLADNQAANGGALYVDRAQLFLSNSTLTGNSATGDGGALFVASHGAAALVNTTLTENQATGNGGSLYARGTLLFSGGEISGNRAGGDGGGAYVAGGALHFDAGALLKANQTITGRGSGLFVLQSTAIFTGATVSGHLGNANAIYAQESDLRFAAGSSLFDNRVFQGNGGALYASGGSLRLEGMTVISNSTDVGDGGALYVVTGTLSIADSALSRNLAFANGGAIAVLSGTLDMERAAFAQNRALAQGGALYVAGSSATLRTPALDANTAGLNGGAAYLRDSLVTVSGGSISANTAKNGSGGGIFAQGGGLTLAQSTRVAENQAGLAAELAASVDVSPRDPRVLQPVAFAISVDNNGPEPTTNVQARTVLPGPLLYLSHTANGGTFDPATGIFSITALARGGSAKLTINALPTQEGTFTSTVEIVGQDLYDPITSNNGDSARVTVSNSAGRQAGGVRAGAGNATLSISAPAAGYALESVYDLLGKHGYLEPAPQVGLARLGARAAVTIAANGGGLAVHDGTITLTDVLLDQNQAVFNGGGLYASESLVLVSGGSRFSSNRAVFGGGGGMAALGGTATVENGAFQSNRAVNGGGLYASAGLSVTVSTASFTENSATASGGGLYLLGDASLLQGNIIHKNVAGQGGGFLLGSRAAVVTGNTIDQNRSSLATTVAQGRAVGVGAGGYLIGTADLTFSGNRVTHNTIPYETITRLLAIVEDRVVIEGTDPPTIIEPGPQFETKAHVDNGGGLYMQEVTGTLTANIFSGNAASGEGGGLYIVGGKLALINDLLVQNRIGISITLGSALLISGTDLSLIHTTIADNLHENLDGDGRNTAVSLFGKGNKLTMLNSIVANHEVGVEGDPANQVDGTNNVWWNHSIRHWGKDLFGDFSIHLFGDPQFVDPVGGDYRIKRNSAAFDAGVATAADFGWDGIATDLAGAPRLRAFAVDAGAYEQRYASGLYLTQQPSQRIVADGVSFSYVISVVNHSPAAVADVALQNFLPGDSSARLTALAIVSSRGVCDLASLTCGLGTIGPDEVVAVTLLAQAHGAPPPHSMLKLVNRVAVGAPGLDPAQSDTTSDDTTFLQLMYTGGGAGARAGDVVHDTSCRVNLLSEVYDDGLPHPNGKDYPTLQAAINASARKSDLIRVSGYCGVPTVNLQVKLTIQGGWSTDMRVLDPDAYPTTLDAAHRGPVLRITEQTAPTVENLELVNGSAASGGCVYIKQSSVTLRNIQMRNCSAIVRGGGLFVDRFSKPLLLDSLVEASSANAAGAGVYVKESGVEIKNTIIRNNSGAADGGGLYLKKSDATVTGSTISGHSVTADGGGIYLDASAASIQHNTIRGNLASWAGGGIFADNSPASISFNRIENNSADGIPVYVDLFLFKIDISGGGGGIYGRKSDMRITNNQIIGNRASVLTGAGIHLWDGNQPQIDGNVVAKNNGNGIFLRLTPPIFKFYILIPPLQPPPFDPTLIFPLPKPAPIRMRHNTIHANTSAGVVIFGRTAIEMTDNIITANGKGVVGVSDFYLHIIFIMYSVPFVPIPIPIPIPIPTFYPPAAELDITLWGTGGVSTFPDPLSFVFGEWSEGESIKPGEDPGFKDPANNDFHIKRISPAFQSGLNTDVATDFDGEKRVQGEIADLGADEYTFRETRYATPTGGDGAGGRCLNYKSPCSIQKALDAAEEGDLIKVAGGVYSAVETRHGMTQIAYVERQVTIQGGYCATTSSFSGVDDCDWEYPFPAKYPVLLDAAGNGRAMVITKTVAPEIFDIQLTGGDASAGGMNGEGGGLYLFGSSPVLSNVVIYGNKARRGGGVYLAAGAAQLSSVVVRDNEAVDGGGVAFGPGSLGTVISATITGNRAERGGGVHFALAGTEENSAALLASTIVSNTASTGGGGVYAEASKATVQQNRVEENSAPAGGGVYLGPTQESSLTRVLSNTISNNSASAGGGLYLDNAGGSVEGNVVQQNSATQGGGFYMGASKTGATGNTVSGNRAVDGGGFYLRAAPDASVVSNRVTGNTATAAGGGFALDASSSSLDKNEISANVAISGGGLYLVNFSAAKLTANQVLSNTASGEGGGAYLKQSPAQWKETTLRGNRALGGSGGGLFAKLSAMLFENGQVEGNTAALLGGGLFLDESNTLVQSSRFYTNSAAGDGGGLYLYRSSEAKVVDSEVRGNRADANGGGLVINDSNSTLKNLAVVDNAADGLGGALYLSKSIVQSDRLLARGNRAQNGGGIYLTTNSSGFFYATALVDNQAVDGAGALFIAGSSPTFYQTTIARNRGSSAVTSESFGLERSAPAFVNTLIAAQPVALQISAANSATLEATLWHGVATPWTGPVPPYTGTVNLYGDPLFAADGYHITKASPAVNNGVETKAATDIDGDTLPQFSIPDIGADEVPVECAARLAGNPAITYGDVQSAVDAAAPGELVKVAGTCKGVSSRQGKSQSLYLDKSVHIRGGYDALNWEISYPLTQPTTITGLGLGRVLYITGAGEPTIESLVLRDGSAAGQGGGPDGQDGGGNVYVDGATAIFSNTQILNGNAYYGGGLFLLRSPSTIITNTFADNKATAGGVIFAQESSAILTENLFSANGATGDGGALFLSRSPAVLARNHFVSNSAATAGGALFANSSPATLLENSFFGNRAKSAGAVYLDASNAQVEGNRFEENGAENAGALLVARSTAQLTANQWFNNTALNGGALYLEASDGTVANNLVISNTASNSGSALYSVGSTPLILHNTFAYNRGGDGSALSLGSAGSTPSRVTFQNNIVAWQTTGLLVLPASRADADANLWHANGADVSALGIFVEGGNRLAVDPAFVDSAARNFRLRSNSPAINRALASAVDRDFEGQPRPVDGAADIGADEYYAPELSLNVQAAPDPVLAGAEVTFHFQAINTGNVVLRATLTATLPAQLVGPKSHTWTDVVIPVGDSWVGSLTGTVAVGFAGALDVGLSATTREGVSSAFAHTAASQLPNAALVLSQQRTPAQLLLGQPARYTLNARNVGNQALRLTITNTLPAQTEPTGQLVWRDVEVPADGVWIQTVVMTPTTGTPPELVNRFEARADNGFYTAHEDRTLIGAPSLLVQPLLVPSPARIGQPFTVTTLITNAGNIDLTTVLTLTIEPAWLGAVSVRTLKIGAGEGARVDVPFPGTSHRGGLRATAQVRTNSGLSSTVVLNGAVELRLLTPSIVSARSGPWDDPASWTPARLPNPADVVLVRGEHTLALSGPVTVGALRQEGRLTCPAGAPLRLIASAEIQNSGEISCAPAGDGIPPGGAGQAGGDIELSAPIVVNDGRIHAGAGGQGAGSAAGGGGGSVRVSADLLSNRGQIVGGQGGVGGSGGPGAPGGAGGDGGAVEIRITSAIGEVNNPGILRAGDGGAGGAGGDGATDKPTGGSGGPGGDGGPIDIAGPGGGQTGAAALLFNAGLIQAGAGGPGKTGGSAAGGGQGGAGGSGGQGGGVNVAGDQDGDGKGSGLDLTNPGTIQAGAGGKGAANGAGSPLAPGGNGGAGGAVQVIGQLLLNDGTLAGGDGGDSDGEGPAGAGPGGAVTLVGGQIGLGEIRSPGRIDGGRGGNGNPAATAAQAGGAGGPVTLAATPRISLTGGQVSGGAGGVGSGGGPPGARGGLTVSGGDGHSADDLGIAITGPQTALQAGDLTISGGTQLLLDLSGLGADAIRVDGVLLIALGPGGVLDLRANGLPVVTAGEIRLFADRFVMDADVALGELLAGQTFVDGSRFHTNAQIVAPALLSGVAGGQVVVPVHLLNLGPLVDSYRMARRDGPLLSRGERSSSGALEAMPSIVPVEGSGVARVAVTVTVPFSATVGSRQALTISAVSYTDSEVQPATQVVIAVRAGGGRLLLPLVSNRRSGVAAASARRLLYLPVIGASAGEGPGSGEREEGEVK